MKFIILLALVLGGVWFYNNNIKTPTGSVELETVDPGVKKIAEETAQKPAKKVTVKDLQTLSNAYTTTDDPYEKAFLVELISYGMLAQNKFRTFSLFRKKVEADHPNEDLFSFMNESFPAVCIKCEGKGSGPCTRCKGKGHCSNHLCKEGRITYETFDGKIEDKACPICKGEAQCKYCEGTGRSLSACASCQGAGHSGVSPEKAEKLFKERLKDLK